MLKPRSRNTGLTLPKGRACAPASVVACISRCVTLPEYGPQHTHAALQVVEVEPALPKAAPLRAAKPRGVLATAFAERFRRRTKVDNSHVREDGKSQELRQEIRRHVARRRIETMERESTVKCSCW